MLEQAAFAGLALKVVQDFMEGRLRRTLRVGLTTPMSELHLDSIAAVELAAVLEDELDLDRSGEGISFHAFRLTGVTTVGEAIDKLRSHQKP